MVNGNIYVTMRQGISTEFCTKQMSWILDSQIASQPRFAQNEINSSRFRLHVSNHGMHIAPFYHALICAAAQSAKVEVLYSEDMQDGLTLGGLTIRNSFVGT